VSTGQGSPGWVLEAVANATILRLHVTTELTQRTIVTCPPEEPPTPLGAVLGVEGVRSLDVHRYRVRLNLGPDADRGQVRTAVAAAVRTVWGEPAPLLVEELPRAFEVDHEGPRRVAESRQMAAGEPILEALFGVEGVAEAIVGDGMVLVRVGRLFRWDDVEPDVRAALP
jgi:hypothetical protein